MNVRNIIKPNPKKNCRRNLSKLVLIFLKINFSWAKITRTEISAKKPISCFESIARATLAPDIYKLYLERFK